MPISLHYFLQLIRKAQERFAYRTNKTTPTNIFFNLQLYAGIFVLK
jgi:hypothetical protein